MPRIESSILVHADVEKVFAIARDIERYPDFMPDVKAIRVTERDGERQVSEWTALVSDLRIEMKWTEEDVWEEATRTCRWRQVKGDFQQYDGVWTFQTHAEGTEMQITLDYRYEVPLIGAMLKILVNKLMKANIETMLAALKTQAEKA